jgi:hypothetical protein
MNYKIQTLGINAGRARRTGAGPRAALLPDELAVGAS